MLLCLQSVWAASQDIYHRIALKLLPEVLGTLPPAYEAHALVLGDVALLLVLRRLHDHELELDSLVLRAVKRLMLAHHSSSSYLGVVVFGRI